MATPRAAAGNGPTSGHTTQGRSAALLVFLATLVAYLPVLRAGFVCDDFAYIPENPTLGSLRGLASIWLDPTASPQYYPLVFTSFWVEWHLFGTDPAGYHVVNVLLHAACAVLLGAALARLRVPGAWGGALLFALHPVEVESVAWIAERKNTLSMLLALLSLHAWVRLEGLDRDPTYTAEARPELGTRARTLIHAALLATFAGALLAKTSVAVLPLALVVVLWWKRTATSGRHSALAARDLVTLLPLVLWGAVLGLTTSVLEKHHVGAMGGDWNEGLLARVVLAARVFWFYAGKLLWPWPLVFMYPRFRIDPGVPWQWIPVVALVLLLAGLLALRARLGKGPLAAVAVFAILLVPASGFFRVYMMRFTYVADHFQYHASAALLALAAAALATLLARTPLARGLVWASLALALGATTWSRAHVYRDAETLWSDTLAQNGEAWMAATNLGMLAAEDGRYADAARFYERSTAVHPEPSVLSNLGTTYVRLGRMPDAFSAFARAVELDPDLTPAWYNWGNALAASGRPEEAARKYAEAVRSDPSFAPARTRWADALATLGRGDQARAQYVRALALDPRSAAARYGMGKLLASAGDTSGARAELERALALEPRSADAREALALVLLREGDREGALRELRQALETARADGASETARRLESRLATIRSDAEPTSAVSGSAAR